MSFKNIALVLLVIFIWGSNFVAIKVGVTAIEPLVLLAMRFTLAGLLFIPFMKWPGWEKARLIMLVGLLMGPLHQGLLYVSLTYLPAGVTSIIMKSNVIMVTLIGWLFLKEKVGWRTWAGIFVGLAGVVVIFSEALFSGEGFSAPPIGYVLAFLSAFFIALTYVAQKKLDVVHAPTYIALMSLPVAPFIMLSSLVVEGTDWMHDLAAIDWQTVGFIVFYQGIILSFSHMLWQKLLVQMPISQIIPWTLLIPVVAVGSAVVLLDEALTRYIIIGGALTISGVGIVTARKIKRSQTSTIKSKLSQNV